MLTVSGMCSVVDVDVAVKLLRKSDITSTICKISIDLLSNLFRLPVDLDF